MKNLPLFAPEQIKSEMFEMLNNKREKYRTEIRNCRLSAELNLKRFKESTQISSEIEQNKKNSNEVMSFFKNLVKFYYIFKERIALYEEIYLFFDKVNEKTDIWDINNIMNKLKQLIFEDLEHCVKYIKRFSILDYIINYFDEIYDDCSDLQYNTLWNFSNIVYFIENEYIVKFLNSHPEITKYLMHFLKNSANNHNMIEMVFIYFFHLNTKNIIY